MNSRNFDTLQACPGNPNYMSKGRGTLFRPLSEWPQEMLNSVVQGWHPSKWTDGWTPISPEYLPHWGGHYSGVWDTLWDTGEEHFRFAQDKGGEKDGSRWFGNRHGKREGKGYKMDSWLYTACWSVHFYDYAQGLTSTVCLFSLNSLSNYFSILCACVWGGISSNNRSRIQVQGPMCLWCQQLEGVQTCECVNNSKSQAWLAGEVA